MYLKFYCYDSLEHAWAKMKQHAISYGTTIKDSLQRGRIFSAHCRVKWSASPSFAGGVYSKTSHLVYTAVYCHSSFCASVFNRCGDVEMA